MWEPHDDDPWDPDEDWEPLQTRRRRTIQVVALLVAVAMVLALVLPVLLRALAESPEPTPPDTGVRALVLGPARGPESLLPPEPNPQTHRPPGPA